MIPEGNPVFGAPPLYYCHCNQTRRQYPILCIPLRERNSTETTVGIELLQKRLAFPQQPNLYLEPKWLRYLSTWARAGPATEDSNAGCYNARPLHIIARSGTRVTNTPRNSTSLTGKSLHRVPVNGSNVLDFCVRAAVPLRPASHIVPLRCTIHQPAPKLYFGAFPHSPATRPSYPCVNISDT